MKTTLNLLLAASPAMADLAAHLPLSLPSLTAGVYFFPVSTSAKVAPGRLAYGAPIRVADPVGVWAVDAPASRPDAAPAACRPADVRDAGDANVAGRCDGSAPGGLLVSMKDSGVAFACYCGSSGDDDEGLAARSEDQRGWNKRASVQRGMQDAVEPQDQRGWNKRNEVQRGMQDAVEPQDQRGWNKRNEDDQRGWNKRNEDDQRGWNKRSEDDSTDQMTTTGVQRGWHKRNEDDQRGWNKRNEDDQRGWNKRNEDDQRGWNKRSDAATTPEQEESSSAPTQQQQPEARAEDATMQPQDQRGWNKRNEDQRGWNKRSDDKKSTADKVQATGVQRGWHRRAMAQRGML